MSRLSVLSNPFLLGFEEIERLIDRTGKGGGEGYPPYNIERTVDADGTEHFLVSIAVAGFSASELEVLAEDNQVVVRGRQKDEPERQFLHRGIAARQFQRSFLLADGMIVKDATLGHGMLVVIVERPRAPKIARRIEIRSV